MHQSNVLNERKYSGVAARIDAFINLLYYESEDGLRFSNPADKEILDLLVAAQMKALGIATSFEDRVKENL